MERKTLGVMCSQGLEDRWWMRDQRFELVHGKRAEMEEGEEGKRGEDSREGGVT